MARRHVHCVVVTDGPDEAGSLWGIVSDLDLAAAASVRDLAGQTAGGTAATEVLTVGPDETLQRAAQLMTEHGTTHLVVVDGAREPIGVVSTLDIAAALGQADAGERAIDVQVTRLRRKIEPDPREPVYLQTVRGRGYVLKPR